MGLNQTKPIPNSTDVEWEISSPDVWWEMSEENAKYKYKPPTGCKRRKEQVFNIYFLLIFSGSLSGPNYLTMILFNDKISPANISFLTRYG
jgi:hypothetical protein